MELCANRVYVGKDPSRNISGVSICASPRALALAEASGNGEDIRERKSGDNPFQYYYLIMEFCMWGRDDVGVGIRPLNLRFFILISMFVCLCTSKRPLFSSVHFFRGYGILDDEGSGWVHFGYTC